MSRLVLSIVMVAVLAGGAFANIPDPALSTVPPVLIVPNNPNNNTPPSGPNTLGYTVNVVGNLGPVNNAAVELRFSPDAYALIAACDGLDGESPFCDLTAPVPPATDQICSALTDPSGDATFYISGGGCILPGAVNPYTVEVWANGVLLRTNLKIFSPDAVNSSGQTTAVSEASNCDDNVTEVGLGDAVFHTGDFAGISYNACSDFDNDESANLADAVIGTQYIINGNTCSCAP
jgi:hypothetical protein